jgi:hypothetical protein
MVYYNCLRTLVQLLLNIKKTCNTFDTVLFVWFCLMPLLTIFQLYRGGQLLVEETGGPGENHWPVASHWQTLSHNVVHLALIEIQTHNISGDRHWLHK